MRFPPIESNPMFRLSTVGCPGWFKFLVHGGLTAAVASHSSTPKLGDDDALKAKPARPVNVSTRLLGPVGI